MAFQLTDDLLDADNGGEDAGKNTFSKHLGPEGARERLSTLTEQAVRALAPFGDAARPLQLLASHVQSRIR